jgi:hypothetical protein
LFLLRDRINLSGGLVLFVIGALFIAGYFSSRNYGLLIPGCILAGLGAGEFIGDSSLGLGLGFIAIFAIDTLVRGRTSAWWPLIPGVIIAGNAVADRNDAVFGTIRQVANDWWPIVLVLIGVIILAQALSGRRA